ncbi:MAG TPA: hypothetical protein VKP69_33780 [Isosphaeraceae bacterium]|nr:hypothetical protein [Isosphaeraceae bacterium]
MANASVEKLKALGLRHGEKAVVGLAAALCLVLLGRAATRPTIDLTPEQVRKDVEAAESNITRRRKSEEILARLEASGLKNPGFEEMVDAQEEHPLIAADYRPAQPWVTPEPGAGLIRDTPELIAPSELYAYPGRGGALVFALDEDDNRIPADVEKEGPDEATKLRRSRKRNLMSMRPSSMSMPGLGSGMPASQKEKEGEAAKRQRESEQRRLKGQLVGKVEEKEEAAPAPEGPQAWKEITKGLRWVTITGTFDHKKLRENYLTALKNPAVAHPQYKQLDVQRQTRQPDGSWSDWEDVDRGRNNQILDNLPEQEEELTPESVRIGALVDPLPFLKAGYWERVHVARLVPREKRELPPTRVAAGSSMDSSMPMSSSGNGSNRTSGVEGTPGAVEDTNFPKTDADTIMIRALDFTVEPDKTYRFRVRIVVYNPNRDREDVAPGVDHKSFELFGPWSDPTAGVTMPPDVATYVLSKTPPAGKRADQVHFQVTRWNAENGVTVVRTFDAGPGEIVGELRTADVPASDGTGKKPMKIDFNSHEVVLDTTGGYQPLPPLGVGGAPLAVPVTSLLVHPDGTVVLRNQADDLHDEVRKDTASNYERELNESDRKRENSLGSGSRSWKLEK